VWAHIPEKIDTNETVRELLEADKKEVFISKVKEGYAAKFQEVLNGEEVSVDELIEKVLNDFV